MEEILSIVFLIIIGLSGLIKKSVEEKSAKKRHRDSWTPVDPNDLPEMTRRKLYGGTGEPPLARPRGTTEIPPAVPRQAPPRRRQPVPEARPTSQHQTPRQAPVQQQAKPVRRESMRKSSASQSRTVPVSRPQQQAPPMRQHAEHMLKRAEHMRKPVQQSAPQPRQAPAHRAQPAQQRRRAPKQAQKHRVPARRVPVPQRPVAAPAGSIVQLFSNLDTVKQGIIMQEVLGKPKALRDFY